MRSDRRGLWRTGVRLLVTGVLLFLVLHFVAPGSVLSVIGSARPGWLLAAVPLVLVLPVLSAARLGVLLRGQGAPLGLTEIVRINFATGFWSMFVPGTLAAGPIRWLKLSRAGVGRVEPVAAIVYSRIAYMGTLALLGAAFVALEAPSGTTAAALVSLLLLIGLLAALAMVATRAERWAFIRRLPGGADGPLHRLTAAAARYRGLPGRDRAWVIGYAAAENLVGTVLIFFLALALRVEISFLTLGWVRALVNLLTSLPITISGLGVREGGLMVALEPYGVSGSQAVALAMLVLGTKLLVAAVGGVLEAIDFLAVRDAPSRRGADAR